MVFSRICITVHSSCEHSSTSHKFTAWKHAISMIYKICHLLASPLQMYIIYFGYVDFPTPNEHLSRIALSKADLEKVRRQTLTTQCKICDEWCPFLEQLVLRQIALSRKWILICQNARILSEFGSLYPAIPGAFNVLSPQYIFHHYSRYEKCSNTSLQLQCSQQQTQPKSWARIFDFSIMDVQQYFLNTFRASSNENRLSTLFNII